MAFYYQGKNFYLDGEPFVVRSGAIHYFRIPSFYWRDRLLKLKECGFNCVETYVAWNLHERKEGGFDFCGELDLATFIDTAADLGLKVIIRPGPYICAEWEFGGLPSWLLTYPKLQLRTSDGLFLSKVRAFFTELFKIITPRLCTRGGNILMLQIENEYGSYGNDCEYLKRLVEIYRENGVDCLLFTADGPEKIFFESSTLPEHLAFANFGSRAEKNMSMLEEMRPNQPLMCAEFWCGWFDYWHQEHHVRSAEDICNNVEPFLKNGQSFNFYMFCGGTNFGFTNGANYFDQIYRPIVTSYDYNALLTEAGDRTAAYYGVRALFEKYGVQVPALTAKETKKRGYGKVALSACTTLFDNLSAIGEEQESVLPLSMEECGQDFGYILYSSTVEGNLEESAIEIDGLADRAIIFADGKKLGVYERGQEYKKCLLSTKEKVKLDVLIENMGRINFGPHLCDKKGMCSLRLKNSWRWNRHVCNWKITTLPMEKLENLCFDREGVCEIPAFYKGTFTVDEIADTYFKPSGFSKGFVVINGFNLGRFYNEAGPQKTLYVPACVLRKGENELIIFDSDGPKRLEAEFLSKPEL